MNPLSEEIQFECKWRDCGKLYSTAIECFEHCKLEHIPRGTVICQWEDCTKVATIRSNLVSHMNKHITINTDSCFICDRSFRWRGDYVRHNNKHNFEEQEFNQVANMLFKR